MPKQYETTAHQVAAEQRHAAGQKAATALVLAAGPAIRGHDITRVDTVIDFGQHEVAEQLMAMAPCGCFDDVLAAAVVLVSELTLRLADVPPDFEGTDSRG